MTAKSRSSKKSGSAYISDDAGDKDRLIAELNDRILLLENELRLKQEDVTSRGINAQKRAEEALRENERFLNNVFDSIKDGISVLDPNLNILRVNRTMEMWHPDMMPLAGKKCYFAYHGRSEPCEWCPNLKAMKEKSPLANIVPRDVAGRTVGWQEVYSFPLQDDDGNVIGVIDYVRDITDRKQAEEMLARERELLERIIDAIPVMITIYNPGLDNFILNNEFRRVLGWTAQDTRDGLLMERCYPDPAYRAEVSQFMASPHSGWRDFKVTARDGRIIESSWANIMLSDSTWIGIGVDITERKLAENRLIQKLSEIETIFKALPDLYFRLSVDGVILDYLAGEFSDLYVRPEEFLGKKMADVLPREVAEKFLRATMAAMDTGKLTIIEYALPMQDSLRDYEARIMPLTGDQLIIVIRNITRKKQSEKALKDAKARAELYLDLMGHDINNLHQIALGYIELARDTPPGTLHDELLERPIEVLQRSAQLIKNVRMLQKLSEGRFQAHEVDIGIVLAEVQREFGSVPRKVVTLDLNGCEHCRVRANELLHDIFANLVSNAIKHTGSHADIVIDLNDVTDNGHRYCRVTVEDNGPGIPDDFKGVIFNRGLKGTSRAKGMGLGLYLVKSLVDSYNGRVWVEDRVTGDHTKGARFVVMLPAACIEGL